MILISAGHYSLSPGAQYMSFSEFPQTMIWAHEIVKRLKKMSLPVGLVPTGTLTKKVQFINDFAKRGESVWAVFEIHFNAGGGQGSESLYFPGSKLGKQYAEAIQRELGPVFGKDRGVKEGWYQQDPSRGTLYLLRETHCPAVIIEPEFVEHYEKIHAKREAACDAIAEAIYDTFHSFI